jgi:hypothetical protein
MEKLMALSAAMEEKLEARFALPDDARIAQHAAQGAIRMGIVVSKAVRKFAIASAAAAVVVVAAALLFVHFYFDKTFSYELKQTVMRCSDGIEIKEKGGDWRPLFAGAKLRGKVELRTSPEAQSFLSFDGIRLLADHRTRLVMKGARSFAVEDGEVFLASAERELPVTIDLEDALVRSNGSVLRVEQKDNSVTVGVATGAAEITLADGTSHKIAAGNSATIKKGSETLDLVSAKVADPFARKKILAIHRARERFEKVIARYLPNYRISRQSETSFRLTDLLDQHRRLDEMYQFASYTPESMHTLARAVSVDVDEYYESLFAPSNRAIAMGRQSKVRLRPGMAPSTSAWSHDGSMLAFIEAAQDSPYARVRVVKLDDLQNPWDISQECESVLPYEEVAWSPDNRHVLFMMTDNLEVYEDGTWDWKGPYKTKIAPIDPEAGPLRDFDSPFRDIPVDLSLPVGRTVSPHTLKLPWGDALLCVNWGNIGYIPIEQDGQSVPHAPALHLTDFDLREVLVMGAQWSPSASMIMFTAVDNLNFRQFKTYILYDVKDILDGFSSPPRSLDDPRIKWVAPTRNFQIRGGFSYDESLAFFQEDVNRAFDVRNLTDLRRCNFDLLYASAIPERESGIAQIHVPGSQLFMRLSPEGNRLAYSNYTFERKRGSIEGKGELRVVSFDIETEVEVDLGGFLMDNSGTNLIVPPGTLQDDFGVTISTPFTVGEEAELTEGDSTYFAMRLLDAKGLEDPEFIEPMTLTIRYTDDEVAGLDEGMLDIYYYDESDPENPAWVPLGATVDPEYNEITVEIQHFSKFAVGGEKRESIETR